MKTKINPHAAKFAEKMHGVIEQYYRLTFVLYDYGSSPSLAYWTGRQRQCTKNIHFIREHIRGMTVEHIKRQHIESLKFRAGLRRLRCFRQTAQETHGGAYA